MERYIFSGGLTKTMANLLSNIPDFKPMDVLVTQLDKSSIQCMLDLKKDGVVKSLFIDSGAYSMYTGKAKDLDVDEYIDFVNSIDDDICLIAQLDTLPGKFGIPKKREDYIESGKKSWENYLYMRKKLKSPEKLIPVFHYGEPFSVLQNMLDWRDKTYDPSKDSRKKNDKGQVWSDEFGWIYPDRVVVCGLSPANDSAQGVKNRYLAECYDFIAKSSYTDIKTHLFGMTSLDALKKFPAFSADSVSHRLRTGYNKLFTRKWGTISLSDKSRTVKTKSNMSFLETCDEATYKEFEDLAASYGFTIEQLKNENSCRVAFDIVEVQKAIEEDWKYKETNHIRSKKLF
jgi:hypothetical protein